MSKTKYSDKHFQSLPCPANWHGMFNDPESGTQWGFIDFGDREREYGFIDERGKTSLIDASKNRIAANRVSVQAHRFTHEGHIKCLSIILHSAFAWVHDEDALAGQIPIKGSLRNG